MPAVGFDLVFITVDQVQASVGDDGLSSSEEGVLGQLVVVIQKRNIVAGRQGQSRVRRRRDIAALLPENDFDA